ncbi:MbnH family di-heme enzyme [Aliikangiella sp. IMCC44359]|uniref:MbnH family di-heme enzyme n=1 Tax=Aliikangiella sp. IMCC44359 TaxID=3459125 RepID=UPI00403AB400
MNQRWLYLAFILLVSCQESAEQPIAYQWALRKDFPRPQVPLENPMTEAKVELGRHIFYDKNLSANGTQSCASCHQQKFAFAEDRKTSIGSTGEVHRRNSPALVNIAYNKTLTWSHDGLKTIEHQLLLPMFGDNPIELGITNHEEKVLERFKAKKYQPLFSKAFPDQAVSFKNISYALASFVRSLVSFNSPFDRYAYDNDDTAISQSALRGMTLFFSEKLECHHCHGGFNFTQSTSHEKQLLDRRPFHNTGLYNINGNNLYPKSDTGLSEITLNPNDNGRFRAPTLRNIALTSPYMHDGSIATLSEVVDFYAAGGRNIIDGVHKGDGRLNIKKSTFMKGFTITKEEKADLIIFLNSLTDKKFISNKKHALPLP